MSFFLFIIYGKAFFFVKTKIVYLIYRRLINFIVSLEGNQYLKGNMSFLDDTQLKKKKTIKYKGNNKTFHLQSFTLLYKNWKSKKENESIKPYYILNHLLFSETRTTIYI